MYRSLWNTERSRTPFQKKPSITGQSQPSESYFKNFRTPLLAAYTSAPRGAASPPRHLLRAPGPGAAPAPASPIASLPGRGGFRYARAHAAALVDFARAISAALGFSPRRTALRIWPVPERSCHSRPCSICALAEVNVRVVYIVEI